MAAIHENSTSREEVRAHLDEILASAIVAFIDVDSQSAIMSFNLATISCITLIVEREREIKQFADSPPERYTLDSFSSALVEIGLDKDDYLESAITVSIDNGYIQRLDNGELRAEMSAFMMVGFLDSMFPAMQGMNLIAFVLQMNDEVTSGRKSLELAKQSFSTSLKNRGVTVTKDRAEQRARQIAQGEQQHGAGNAREISTHLKKENLDRLSHLIRTRKKKSGDYQQKIKVKNVFDKGPSKGALEVEEKENQRAEEAVRKAAELDRQLADKDEKIKAAEAAARTLSQQLKSLEKMEKTLETVKEEAKEAKAKAAAFEAKEAEMAEREAKLKALEEQIRVKEEEARQAHEHRIKAEALAKAKQQAKDEEDIESQIAAFEMDLAMPCPLCADGKIEEKTTKKGKTFFSCNGQDCRFVSWDKPYHFECPLCKNPFLTEVTVSSGEKGLKCPRAACSYTQNNLLDPMQNMAAAAEAVKPKKKKKRIVRRRKRR